MERTERVPRVSLDIAGLSEMNFTPMQPNTERITVISQASNYEENLGDQAQILRETIHQTQLKDAITRQELSKVNRENVEMKQQITALQSQLAELEKGIALDERFLSKQEKEIAENRIAAQKLELQQKGEFETQKELYDKCRQSIKEIKKRHEEEMNICVDIQNQFKLLRDAVASDAQNNEVMEHMRKIMQLYEDRVKHKERATEFIEDIGEMQVRDARSKLLAINSEYEEIKQMRIIDRKILHQQDKRLTLRQGDANFHKVVKDEVSDKAVDIAEKILNRLKEKLVDNTNMSHFVDK
jgi:hypothetical protein